MSSGCDSGVHVTEDGGDGCPCGLVRCDDAGSVAVMIHDPLDPPNGRHWADPPAVPVDLMPLLRRMDARLERMERALGEIGTAVMGEER